MRFTIICSLFLMLAFADQPVMSNPGIPAKESLTVYDYINKDVGYVTALISIQKKGNYYVIESKEGSYYTNFITLNVSDLTTVAERRVDTRKNQIVEAYSLTGDQVYFYNRDKGVSLKDKAPDKNIYSRYAFMFSLRGYPFEKADSVTFKTYMFEYGNYLPINVAYKGKTAVKVKAGSFDCYKLELSIGGWQQVFAASKYYLYFTVAKPHQFIKFDQKVDSGAWLSNEVISIK